MNAGPDDGVLLVSHGTVESLDELPAYLERVRGGRPASPELLRTMRERYRAIGGSPLAAITAGQAQALGRELGLPVVVGTRFGRPSLREALERARGLQRLVVLPLAPFNVPAYLRAAQEASREGDPELVPVEPWGTEPGLVSAHVDALRDALASLRDAAVLLTAHSVPVQVVRTGDRYPMEVMASADAIGKALGVPYELGFQSGGKGEGWLGPSLSEVLGKLRAQGHPSVVVSPIGFLAEHVETLYDLDIAARDEALALGLGWRRVPALNSAHGLIRALSEVAMRALAKARRR